MKTNDSQFASVRPLTGSNAFGGTFCVQTIALVQSSEVTLDGEFAIDNWVFAGQVRLVEVVNVFHMCAADTWRGSTGSTGSKLLLRLNEVGVKWGKGSCGLWVSKNTIDEYFKDSLIIYMHIYIYIYIYIYY